MTNPLFTTNGQASPQISRTDYQDSELIFMKFEKNTVPWLSNMTKKFTLSSSSLLLWEDITGLTLGMLSTTSPNTQ